jgi:signal transduction histidine kinase
MDSHGLRKKINRRMGTDRSPPRWLLYAGFALLALLAPTLIGYDIYYQLDSSGTSLNRLDVERLMTAAGVVAIFWLFTGFLLIRRFHQGIVRLLFVHGQILSMTMVYPLAHPSPWNEPPGILRLSIAAFYLLAPLTLHIHISFPVVLGTRRQRKWALSMLYLAALASLLAWLSGSQLLRQVGELYTLTIFTLSIAVLIYAYAFRAIPDSRRRLRIIWFGTLLAIVPTNILYFVPGLFGWPVRIPVWLVGLLLIIVPVSYLNAITRQNLFGIDRLLNRTLVYVILASGIFAVYLTPLIYLYNVLSIGWLGQAVVSAGITLVIGWNFTWLRTRIQRLVDRLFYGGWYDYAGVVETISHALARSLERAQVTEVLTRQVPRLMRLNPGKFFIGDPSDVHTLHEQLPYLTFSFNLQGGMKAIWQVAGHRDGEGLSADDQRILKTLAQQAEIALNNVVLVEALRRQLEEIQSSRETLTRIQHQLLRSREEERSRLARELHDGPLQTLIGMNMQLGVLQRSISYRDNGALQELRTEVRNLLEDLRRVCSELRPPMLDALGLGAALRALTEEWSQQHGIGIRLDLPKDANLRSLPGEKAVNLFRVTQEALTNIARHAGAEKVVIVMKTDGDAHELSIQDDGCGFHVPAMLHDLAANNHFGLVGIRERVELIGGSLAIKSEPGEGTLVQVRL